MPATWPYTKNPNQRIITATDIHEYVVDVSGCQTQGDFFRMLKARDIHVLKPNSRFIQTLCGANNQPLSLDDEVGIFESQIPLHITTQSHILIRSRPEMYEVTVRVTLQTGIRNGRYTKVITVLVMGNDNVMSLKERIEYDTEIDRGDMELGFEGNILPDNARIYERGVREGHLLHVFMKCSIIFRYEEAESVISWIEPGLLTDLLAELRESTMQTSTNYDS